MSLRLSHLRVLLTAKRIELVLAWKLPFTCPTPCFVRKFWYHQKLGCFRLWQILPHKFLSDAGLQRKIDAAPGIHLKCVNCPKTLDLENFATLVSGLVHKAHRWSSLWITPFTHPHIHYTLVDCIPSNSVTSFCAVPSSGVKHCVKHLCLSVCP